MENIFNSMTLSGWQGIQYWTPPEREEISSIFSGPSTFY
jgi:hypothetical protein